MRSRDWEIRATDKSKDGGSFDLGSEAPFTAADVGESVALDLDRAGRLVPAGDRQDKGRGDYTITGVTGGIKETSEMNSRYFYRDDRAGNQCWRHIDCGGMVLFWPTCRSDKVPKGSTTAVCCCQVHWIRERLPCGRLSEWRQRAGLAPSGRLIGRGERG